MENLIFGVNFHWIPSSIFSKLICAHENVIQYCFLYNTDKRNTLNVKFKCGLTHSNIPLKLLEWYLWPLLCPVTKGTKICLKFLNYILRDNCKCGGHFWYVHQLYTVCFFLLEHLQTRWFSQKYQAKNEWRRLGLVKEPG